MSERAKPRPLPDYTTIQGLEDEVWREGEDAVLSRVAIQSYVLDRFFVSTIYRLSSALEGGWYYETMAWERIGDDWYGRLIAERSGIRSHFDICQELMNGQLVGKEGE